MNQQLKPYKTVEEIAKKHRLEVSFIQKQLDMGAPIEHEHTKNQKLAVKIALQHLDEIPDYYTRLKKMEASAKKEHKKFRDFKEHCGCEDDAVGELESKLKKLDGTSYDSIDKLMRSIMKKHDMTAKQLHNAFVDKNGKTPDDWIKNKSISEGIRDNKRSGDPGYSLRDWFKGGGWVQAGGKYDGKPCAKQPGQKTKPYCRDPDDRASLSKDERDKRAAKKRKEDSNPNRSGKANMVTQEAAGEKDACYNKVKSRYKIWPSAYASGALSKCRKVGADNWGTKTEQTSLNYDWDTPIRERPDRYCPKCEKVELRSECRYGPKYWDMYSMPAEIITNKKDYKITMPYSAPDAIPAASSLSSNQMKYNIATVHPANEEKDHEYSMARSELSTIISAAKRLKKKMKGEGEIEAWVQSKITKAADYIDTAADYLESGEHKVSEDCWGGYKQVGMKKKGKKMVPNCVPESVSIEDADGNHYAEFIDIIKPEPLKQSKGIGSDLLGEGPSFEIGGKKTTGMGAMTPQDVDRLKQGNPGASGKIDQKYQQIRQGINLPLAKKEHKKELQVAHYEPDLKTFQQFTEDWQKVNRNDKTDGLSQTAVNAYRRENPGSKLQTAVTEKNPKGKRADRRSNFCSRMKGHKAKNTSAETARDPDSRINKALRRWNCN
jgi:hypothetical protein